MAKNSTGQQIGRRFVSTHWSLVLAARGRTTEEGAAALTWLCRMYWSPVYAYIRRRGYPVEDAQDLTQAYFSRLLEKNYLFQANADRGKFRSFLLASLKNFLANEWDREKAKKRGGSVEFVSLEDMEGTESRYAVSQQAGVLTPERLYERSWALTQLERAIERLAEDFAKAGKAQVFIHLKPFLMGDAADQTYSDAASVLGMGEGAIRVAVHRLRSRFRDFLRAEIAQTLSDPDNPDAVEEEIRYLLTIL